MSGFVYIWKDRKHNRYYVGSHWGSEDDGYICSSSWMKRAHKLRPNDFRRKILSRINTNRSDLLKEEQRWFDMIKPEEIKVKYYNLTLVAHAVWHTLDDSRLSVGEKISKAKKGKNTGYRDPSVGEKISEVKKKKFQERRQLTGSSFTEEHHKNMAECKIGTKQTEESNLKRSETLKSKYKSGEIKSKPVVHTEQSKANLSKKLKGIVRSDETKTKMSKAQSKNYKITFIDGNTIIVDGLKTFCINNNIPYVTARKALEAGASIKKYNVFSIMELPKEETSTRL